MQVISKASTDRVLALLFCQGMECLFRAACGTQYSNAPPISDLLSPFLFTSIGAFAVYGYGVHIDRERKVLH